MAGDAPSTWVSTSPSCLLSSTSSHSYLQQAFGEWTCRWKTDPLSLSDLLNKCVHFLKILYEIQEITKEGKNKKNMLEKTWTAKTGKVGRRRELTVEKRRGWGWGVEEEPTSSQKAQEVALLFGNWWLPGPERRGRVWKGLRVEKLNTWERNGKESETTDRKYESLRHSKHQCGLLKA